ncbi:MAG: glycogen debranching enzyme, partial [Actinomycetaceae bacterium]|nr:glycogen debranching enzyme [Actinomycetaceae bacterium]
MIASDKPYSSIEFEIVESEPIKARPPRFGAHLIDGGSDFVVRSPHASQVLVCLVDVDTDGTRRERLFSLHRAPHFWQGHIPDVKAGQLYGYRIDGQWSPDSGLMFNRAKFLLDPYTRALAGSVKLSPALFGYEVDGDYLPTQPYTMNREDSAPFMPCGVIVEET